MINADAIAAMKAKTNLVDLFAHYGIQPLKKGSAYLALCPFHKEDTPSLSINPKKNLWQCFGCNEGGDALSLIQKLDKLSFMDAAKKLAVIAGIPESELTITQLKKKTKPETKNKEERQNPTAPALLNTVAEIYHRAFMDQPDGRAYLAARGISEARLFAEHQIGLANGSLIAALNETPSMIAQLTASGLLLDNQRERFLNCVVFPLRDDHGNVVSFYGRHLQNGHFYLPGPRHGLFNRKLTADAVILTESIIDSLSFMQQGLHNVLPIYGTNGFTAEHLDLLNQIQPKEIVIALDGDETGLHAARQLKEKLAALSCHVVTFPDGQDANDFFMTHSAEDFARLHAPAQNTQKPDTVEKNTAGNDTQGVTIELKYSELKAGKLTATIHVVNPKTKRFLLDTFNLYSQKQRQELALALAKLLVCTSDDAEKMVHALIAQAESKSAKCAPDPSAPVVQMSEEDEKEAMAFLAQPDILDQIPIDYETLGYTGERANKQLAYLVMTSRKIANPLSLLIVSNASAGKSSIQKTTFELCPPEEAKHFTRLTQQSLYYLGEETLKNKFLSIEEEEGSAEATYSLKTLLSSKELKVISTTQDPTTGRRRADEYTTQGPVSVMVSTTNPEIDHEFSSRALIMAVDESQKQTLDIQTIQRLSRTKSGRSVSAQRKQVLKKHQNAQRLLNPALVVVNNYAPQLTFPSHRLRYRRSHTHYLDLIESVAFLRQCQKPKHQDNTLVEYIEVDKEDIRCANDIFMEVLGWTLTELKPPTKSLWKTIIEVCKHNESTTFQRRWILDAGHYSAAQLHRNLKVLEELEYIRLVSGTNGTKYTYELLYDGIPENEDGLFKLKTSTELKENR
jgi:DNA primase catalytic core